MCSWLVGNSPPNGNFKILTHCLLRSAVFKACSLNSSIHIYLEKKTNIEKCRFEYFLWARSKYGAQHFCSHIMGIVTWPYLGRRISSIIFLRRKELWVSCWNSLQIRHPLAYFSSTHRTHSFKVSFQRRTTQNIIYTWFIKYIYEIYNINKNYKL